jgi:hypothetical protein
MEDDAADLTVTAAELTGGNVNREPRCMSAMSDYPPTQTAAGRLKWIRQCFLTMRCVIVPAGPWIRKGSPPSTGSDSSVQSVPCAWLWLNSFVSTWNSTACPSCFIASDQPVCTSSIGVGTTS